MSTKKVVYNDVPEWGNIDSLVEVSNDFLPKPEDLILKPKLKKVTIVLDDDSITFFKSKADTLNTSYQRMIRVLLSTYARKMQNRTHEK